MTGFTPRQLKKLATPLEPTKVKNRVIDGKSLSYLEGWFVLQEANRIFGYDGWDREMVASERTFVRRTGEAVSCGYSARIRIRVRAGGRTVVREGTGFGAASAPEAGDAHERALKAAETDATKRALATFGGRFGLLLYGQGLRVSPPTAPEQVRVPIAERDRLGDFALFACDGTVLSTGSPEGFCTGLRQLIEAADTTGQLQSLRTQNQGSLGQLRAVQGLQTDHGTHYADVLERLFTAKLRLIGARDAHTHQTVKDIGAAPSQRGRDHVPVPPYPLANLRERLGTQPPKDVTAISSDRNSAAIPRNRTAASSSAPAPVVSKGTVSCAKPAPGNPQSTIAASDQSLPSSPTRRSQISGGFSIDKSALALPSERRLRSKAHLMAVSARPCLVCEETPCHAHHITYAQPRGLSQKVSDEFTVPLCPLHHNALHLSGNEPSWWRTQGIDPLPEAQRLWRASQGGDEPLAASGAPSEPRGGTSQ